MKELRNDVMRNMPTRQPVPMSPNTRAQMIERLRNVSAMSQRLESSLPLYLNLSKNEEETKEYLRLVCKFCEYVGDCKLTLASESLCISNSRKLSPAIQTRWTILR